MGQKETEHTEMRGLETNGGMNCVKGLGGWTTGNWGKCPHRWLGKGDSAVGAWMGVTGGAWVESSLIGRWCHSGRRWEFDAQPTGEISCGKEYGMD